MKNSVKSGGSLLVILILAKYCAGRPQREKRATLDPKVSREPGTTVAVREVAAAWAENNLAPQYHTSFSGHAGLTAPRTKPQLPNNCSRYSARSKITAVKLRHLFC